MKHIKTFESFVNEGADSKTINLFKEVVINQLAAELGDESMTKREGIKWLKQNGVHALDSIIEGLSDDERFIDIELDGEDLIKEATDKILKMKDVFED